MMKIKIQEREKQGSGSKEWRKGDNYFNNIVKELSIEDTAEYKEIMRISYADFQRILSYIEKDITRKQVLCGNKVIPPKEILALTIRYLATGETMLKERSKRLQLRFIDSTSFQHFSTRFKAVEKGWQTLSTFQLNKIERKLKRMLQSFARGFNIITYLHPGNTTTLSWPNDELYFVLFRREINGLRVVGVYHEFHMLVDL